MKKVDIKSKNLEQLAAFIEDVGQPRYRAEQIFRWLHTENVPDFDSMTNIPLSVRRILDENSYINSLKIKKKLASRVDDTVKYLYEAMDGQTLETVMMPQPYGASLCISTQVGCRMGCRFCASTIAGLERNLSAGEMLDQIYTTGHNSSVKIGSVVLMGIGEPLDNFEETVKFFEILNSRLGKGMSLRHVSLSTCGLVDKIRLLSEKKLGVTLSVSLHSPNDEIRSRIMPINKRWPVDELLSACKDYFKATGRRVSFEYSLIRGLNDGAIHAKELAQKLKHLNCHVNLIPLNSVAESGFERSTKETVETFKKTLEKSGVTTTIRRERGSDINAACGQLRRQIAPEITP